MMVRYIPSTMIEPDDALLESLKVLHEDFFVARRISFEEFKAKIEELLANNELDNHHNEYLDSYRIDVLEELDLFEAKHYLLLKDRLSVLITAIQECLDDEYADDEDGDEDNDDEDDDEEECVIKIPKRYTAEQGIERIRKTANGVKVLIEEHYLNAFDDVEYQKRLNIITKEILTQCEAAAELLEELKKRC